jgi:hypothetical protein
VRIFSGSLRKEIGMADTRKLGYYVQDTGQNVYRFYMGAEPAEGQYIFTGGAWVPLADGWYLMDLLINGSPDLRGPFLRAS